MEKSGFVYIWYDRKHRRYYVGSHWGYEEDSYVCSSKWMLQAYKIRPQDFRRKILARVYTNKKELLNEENRWLSMIKPNEIGHRYYNLRIHEFGHWSADKDLSDSTRKRISENTKTAIQKPEIREKYLASLETRDNRSSDPLVREKRRESMVKTMAEKFPEENRWKKLTEEERYAYYSEKAKRNWESPEYREKKSKANSEFHKGKQYRLGHINTPEHTAKIVESNKKRAREKMEVYRPLIEETLHLSAIDAAKIVGVGRQIVSKYRKELGF